MKAQSNVTLLKLLSAVALVTVPLLTGGCIAQAGTGTEDPGSTAQGLSSNGGDTAVVAQPQQQGLPTEAERRSNLAEKFTSSTVIKGGTINEMSAPQSDPGGAVMDDGDGREPDPHPWHSSLQRVSN